MLTAADDHLIKAKVPSVLSSAPERRIATANRKYLPTLIDDHN
jgi:hypothetical protein